MIKIHSVYGNKVYDCILSVSEYRNPKSVAIDIISIDDDGYPEPFQNLTVKFAKVPLKENQAFIDVNNLANIEDIMEKYNLGRPTGEVKFSGWCCYPLYNLNMDEIRKHTEIEVKQE